VQGRVVVEQQPDGWWRWRFEPASDDGGPLISGETYPDEQEATQSAGAAYPELRPEVEADADPGSGLGHRFGAALRRTSVAAVVLVVVVAAARSANRRADAVETVRRG